jgi:hypothetical protein
MTSLTDDLLATFGKDFASSEVTDVIRRHGLGDICDDPPFRRYVGSGVKGVDLLYENDKVFDIQIYVQGTKTHSAFSDELPFRMQRGMTDKQVHILFGEPESYVAVGSKYTLFDGAARLTVVYDKSKVVSYLSIRKL